jgi:hypothetical protein
LGSESESFPAYVVMPDPKGALEAGQPMYTNGFLPEVYQPAMFRPGNTPALNLDLPTSTTMEDRCRILRLIRDLNQAKLQPSDTDLSGRLNAYDLAFKMQTEAPAIFDLSKEPTPGLRCTVLESSPLI